MVVQNIMKLFFLWQTKTSASAKYDGVEIFDFIYLRLMILYCTSHEIVLHQTSMSMWNNQKMKILRPIKFSTLAKCVDVKI
jgi:hypothetical protein